MISLYDLLEAADGQLFGDASAALFTEFCLDSRRVTPGALFVAVKTERGDGHQFMREAVDHGALGVICQRPPDFDTALITVIVVRDVETSLLRWARAILQKFGTTVVAVTGSAAISVAKETISKVLATKYRVFKGDDTDFGRLSLPVSLGKLHADDKIAVLPVRIEATGTMEGIAELLQPMVGVVTDVSHQTVVPLIDSAGLAAEFSTLIARLPTNGLAVLNHDDDYSRMLQASARCTTSTIGIDQDGAAFGADFLAYNLLLSYDKTGFDLRYERERYVGRWTPLLGVNALYGVLAALAVGRAYGVALPEALDVLKDIQPSAGYLNPLEGANGSLLLDDSAEANLQSAFALLDWLQALKAHRRSGRTILLLGDLGDFGQHTLVAHREIGRYASKVVDTLVTQGDLAAVAGRGALDSGMERRVVRITYSPEDAAAAILPTLSPEDVVVIKGSSTARMEFATRALLAQSRDVVHLPRFDATGESLYARRPSRGTWVEIDRSAIAHNTRQFKQLLGDDITLMAIVKANAYGHGAVGAAATALQNGAGYLGVHAVHEGIELREAAIEAPILVMGYTAPHLVRQALRHNLTLNVYDLDLARTYNRIAQEMSRSLRVHVEIDSGMGRLGLLPPDVTQFFRSLRNLRHLEVEGIFTHFSSADDNPEYTRRQLSAFDNVVAPLIAGGITFKYVHVSNTAATLNYEEGRSGRINMVRVGIGLYGLAYGAEPLPENFRPALTWKTSVAQVKTLPSGAFVGYGNTYRTKAAEKIAVINVGYADGLRRAPQTWAEVLIGGMRVPIIGRVSMNMTMVSVNEVPNVSIGDEVVLIGEQGSERITADEVAQQLGTIGYEVVSTILANVPRL